MNRRLLSILTAATVLFSGCNEKVITDITVEELQSHTSYMASEKLAGRYPGTEGDRAAADYIFKQFNSYGLFTDAPAGKQVFEITTSVSIGDSNNLEWSEREFELMKDFVPLSYSPNAEVRGMVVFAGYGIITNKAGINRNDFSGSNLQGKVVLLLEGGPEKPLEGEDPYEGILSRRSKILRAQDLGAAAVMFVSGPVFDTDDKLEFTNFKESTTGIPAIRISRGVGNILLSSTGYQVSELEAENLKGRQAPFELELEVSLRTHVISEKETTQNIIGMIKAPEGPHSDEYIVVGAHFDHLGMGGQGTGSRVPDTYAVHYGADDNASGTAGVIELAGFFAGKKKELERSMIFVAFAAEEMGLLGSRYFVENPPVEIEKIKLMFNLDMIGRLNDEQKLTIGGTGTAAEFDSLLSSLNPGSLNLAFSPEGSGPSDHSSFYSHDIPVLYFSTGAHPDYHTPGDSVGKINFEGLNLVTNYLASLGTLMDSQETLSFREAGPKRTESTRQNLKVTLGFMPDFIDNSNSGVKVEFPTPGKPAERAGIKKGDRIIGINGLKVTNVQDYMIRLQTLEPGQIVTVEVNRDGEIIVLLVQV